MLDKSLEFTLNFAFKEARTKRHLFVTVEHLLYALLENGAATDVLRALGANILTIKTQLSIYMNNTAQVIAEDDQAKDTSPTLAFQRVIQRAVFQVQSLGRAEVKGNHVLQALFSETDSKAVEFLISDGITRADVYNYNQFGTLKKRKDSHYSPPQYSSANMMDEEPESKEGALGLYTENLNTKAINEKIDPLVGRDSEIDRTIQILCRRRKNNPILVGETGVGKTAIAEGLANSIVKANVPDVLQGYTIYSLDVGALMAGTKYRGDVEKRVGDILKELKEKKHTILFIDEIHTIIGSGSASGSSLDIANLLKPVLTSGDLKILGSTTYKEYREIFESDPALNRRFQKIDVNPPSVDDAIEILKGIRPNFELYHKIMYSDDAIEASVRLANRYITDRHLPDSAIDIIDEAAASQYLLPIYQRSDIIEVEHIEKVVAKMAQIPERNVTTSDKEMLRYLGRDLKLMIFGQDKAIDTLDAAIKLSRSDLRDSTKPVGAFLFVGPTGVGKTEVCKQLALITGTELIRFDMSEYMESHSVSKLIGAPPGYVGYNEGGLLTEAVNKSPHCIILLDEIEKAHPSIYNILLQVMDNGMLTDSNGRKINFRHAIIVMTSNAGAQYSDKDGIGFNKLDNTTDMLLEVNKIFTPEFRNRLDNVIKFEPLNHEVILSVVDKCIDELALVLEARSVILEVGKDVKEWIAKNGYDIKMGARPLARYIQEHLKKPLAEELLFGVLQDGGKLKIVLNDGCLNFLTDTVKLEDV